MKYMQRMATLLVLILLLAPTVSLAVEGAQAAAGMAQQKSKKILGPMTDLFEFYRDHDALNDENWAVFRKKKLEALIRKVSPEAADKFAAMPVRKGGKTRRNLSKGLVNHSSRGGEPKAAAPFYRMFFDPAEQKKMGWNDDTFQCLVALSDDGGQLRRAGVKIQNLIAHNGGAMARVQLSGKDLEKVAGLDSVVSMAPALKRALDNDLGSRSTGAPRLRLGTPGHYTRGYTGAGTIVGLIDSGIDWTHPDFNDPLTGTTRIRYIWETGRATTYARTPEGMFGGDLAGLDYGTVWTKAEIDGGSCLQTDTNGHGTHTSGTAAGNGSATGQYTGMAPNADIIMVNGLDNNGILFIYEMARRLNKPCAVNMSYGPSLPLHQVAYYPDWFPMDPTDAEGQWIDALNNYYGGGHIPVKSAGNQGHWNTYTDLSGGAFPYKEGGYHAGAPLNGVHSHTLNVPDYVTLWNNWWGVSPGQSDVPELYIGCWMDRPSDIIINDPSGATYTFPFASGGGFSLTPDYNFIICSIDTSPHANGAYAASFWIFPLFGYVGISGVAVQPTQGAWQFTVDPIADGDGFADFWVADFNYYYGGEQAPIDGYTDEIYTTFAGSSSHSNYIIDEGSTPYEITVGAWTTRQGWESIDGHAYTYTERPWMNTIADFSSPGPARNRFTKPDLAAPGQVILSSLSEYSPYAGTPPYIDPDGAHMAMSGTSMAAPHVTGAAALVLQKYPGSSLSSVRGRLKNWARNDAQTAAIGSSGFGAGKLNLLPLNSPPVAVISAAPGEIILDELTHATCNGSASYDPEGFPLTHAFSLIATPAGASATVTTSGQKAALQVDPDIEGAYQVGLVVNDRIADSEMAVATVVAKFYPVLPAAGFAVQRLESDMVFSREYINRLAWQANADNRVTVAGYKLYRKAKGADDASYIPLQQLAPTVFGTDDRGLTADQLFTYRLTTIDSRGRESDPVIAGN